MMSAHASKEQKEIFRSGTADPDGFSHRHLKILAPCSARRLPSAPKVMDSPGNAGCNLEPTRAQTYCVVPTDPAVDKDSGTIVAGVPAVPAGCVIGEPCFAMGLQAGMVGQFTAILLGVRSATPEFLVKYVATTDGRTMSLLLPEVRLTYVQVQDLSPWCEVPPPIPSAAKTRGQQEHRQATRAHVGMGERKRKECANGGGAKRVRFDGRVVVVPPPSCGYDDDDDDDDDRYENVF